jgi:hypothetical protein
MQTNPNGANGETGITKVNTNKPTGVNVQTMRSESHGMMGMFVDATHADQPMPGS